MAKTSKLILLISTMMLGAAMAFAQDSAPNEPPYINPEDEFADPATATQPSARPKQNPTLNPSPQPVTGKKPTPNTTTNSSTPSGSGTVDDGGTQIQHPDAAKGLYMIDKNTGNYYYRIKDATKREQTLGIRVGTYDSPQISAQNSQGDTFTFKDFYGSKQLSMLQIDYDWEPFQSFGKLGFQLGMGLMVATGNGRFLTPQNGNPNLESKEKYTFLAVPVNAGVIYKFQFLKKQWFTPYVSGGGTYFGLLEVRDDGKRTEVAGTPGFYGAGGIMANVSAWSRETAFKLDTEYGVAALYLVLEARYYKSTSSETDMSSGTVSFGFAADY